MRRSSVVVLLGLALAPSSASAGVIRPEGFSTSPAPEKETFTVGIAPWGYEPGFPVVTAHQSSGPNVFFSGYAAAPSYESLSPGSCARRDDDAIDCGLAPAGGEPFAITGSEGEDVFREIACSAYPEGTPCPRVFKIALYGGDDALSMWNFSDSLGDERDPSTGVRPWVAAMRTPMDGVQIDMGAGRDTVTLMGGPSSGFINAGPGDDHIYTQGGYSASEEPATGSYAISCGPGFDVVVPKPEDKVAIDCEQVLEDVDAAFEDKPDDPLRAPADVASTCGFARFDFFKVTHERSVVRKNRHGCVFLVSNRFARDLLQLAYNSDGNISETFVKVLDVARRAARASGTSPSQEALETYVRDALSIPDGQDVMVRALPWWIREGAESAGRANPLALIGEAAGSLAIPMRTLLRIDQIESKGACLQFTVGVRSARARVDSRVIYNPLHHEDASASRARIYQRKERFGSDDFRVRYPNLSCATDGMVTIGKRRAAKRVFHYALTLAGAAR